MRKTLLAACASALPLMTVAVSAHAQAVDQSGPAPATATPSPPVNAPTPQPQSRTQPVPPESSTVQEVVVTAQKRAQNLQDVPIVVTVVNTKQLQDANVHDIKDLTVLTPGLTVTSTGSDASTTARIRGVGTVSDNIGLEDQVGIVIDGVERPRNGVAFNDLGELTDIEVLKGPQGTLFGANTTAGVIAITSAKPSFTFGGSGELTAGNYGYDAAAVSVTGPIYGDQLAGRLYVAGRQRDGFYRVVSPAGDDVPSPNDEHLYTIRGQLLWKPTSTFDVNFIADYTKRNDHSGGSVPILNGIASTLLNVAVPGATAAVPDPTSFTAYNNRANIENITDKGLSAEAHWTTPWFNNAVLTSITGWRDWKDQSGSADSDATAADILVGRVGDFTQFQQFTEELRYQGHTDRLDWLVGSYFKNSDLYLGSGLQFGSQFDQYLQTLVGGLSGGALNFNLMGGITNPATAFPYLQGSHDMYHQHENLEGVFTQETYKLTDKLELTAGFRYTWDDKSLDTHYQNDPGSGSGCASAKATLGVAGFAADPFAGFYCAIVNDNYNDVSSHQDTSSSAATGTAKLAYRFNRELMAYGSYSRGYLVGGFNLARTSLASATGVPNSNPFAINLDTSFAPTYVNAYELGEKATLFNRRVTFDAALFYQDYDQFQLNAFNGLVFVVTSVPEVISRGAEVSSSAQIIRGLSANFGVTYSDTYFPDSSENIAALTPASGLGRLPGHRLSLAPSWSITLGLAYERELFDNLWLNTALDGKYASTYNTGSDLDPAKVQPSFWLWDGTIGIGPHDGKWNLSMWAQNLFNQPYYQVAYNGALTTLGGPGLNTYNAFLGRPRTFGATLRFKY